MEQIGRNIEKSETAVEPAFQDHFIKAMAIPHKTDPYAKLSAAVTLPERSMGSNDNDGSGERTGRRRRRPR